MMFASVGLIFCLFASVWMRIVFFPQSAACRHEFCWICMRPWSTHGQATGGYFKCNDFAGEGPNTAQDEIRRAEQKEQVDWCG